MKCSCGLILMTAEFHSTRRPPCAVLLMAAGIPTWYQGYEKDTGLSHQLGSYYTTCDLYLLFRKGCCSSKIYFGPSYLG